MLIANAELLPPIYTELIKPATTFVLYCLIVLLLLSLLMTIYVHTIAPYLESRKKIRRNKRRD